MILGAGLWGVAGSVVCRRRRIRWIRCIRQPAPPPPKTPEESKPVIEGADNAASWRLQGGMRGFGWM